MSVTMLDTPQRSAAWFAARAGRLTGACAGAMRAEGRDGQEAITRADLRARLVAERRSGRSQDDAGFSSAEMRHGIAQEPAAVAAYEVHTGRIVRPSGFVSHNELMAGCSLDGHIGAPLEGILEIKCPKSTTHLAYLRAGRVPPQYLRQITHNLWMTGAAWCDFVSFDDRLPAPHHLAIVRVRASDVDLVDYAAAALAFLDEVARELAGLAPTRTFTELLHASLMARQAAGGVH